MSQIFTFLWYHYSKTKYSNIKNSLVVNLVFNIFLYKYACVCFFLYGLIHVSLDLFLDKRFQTLLRAFQILPKWDGIKGIISFLHVSGNCKPCSGTQYCAVPAKWGTRPGTDFWNLASYCLQKELLTSQPLYLCIWSFLSTKFFLILIVILVAPIIKTCICHILRLMKWCRFLHKQMHHAWFLLDEGQMEVGQSTIHDP